MKRTSVLSRFRRSIVAFCRFLWKDESIWSWILSVLIAFLVIKWGVYPLLSGLLGTTHPIVAVVSGSMEHEGYGFSSWWQQQTCCQGGVCKDQAQMYADYNISRDEFSSYRFHNGFNKGDLMVLVGVDDEDVDKGDVLVFTTSVVHEPIIHRVIHVDVIGNERFFTTKGDNNCALSPFEKRITEERFIGRAVLRVPYLGWIKIAFVELVNVVPFGGR